MKFKQLELDGVFEIQLEPNTDERGFFVRSFCKNEMKEINSNFEMAQINHTLTNQKGSIRGMHYQNPPYAETKIVRCIKGQVFDCMVDLRKNSPTFLKWYGDILSECNMKAFYIPKGFAHGFQTLTDDVEMLYFHDEFYNKDFERGIRYNDKKVGINWKIDITNLSKRDLEHELLTENFKGIEL